MNEQECYECGCCEHDGWCLCNNMYINEITECNASDEEKDKHSVWSVHNDEA